MKKVRLVLVAGIIGASSLSIGGSAQASGCPDPDNPCTPQTIDVMCILKRNC